MPSLVQILSRLGRQGTASRIRGLVLFPLFLNQLVYYLNSELWSQYSQWRLIISTLLFGVIAFLTLQVLQVIAEWIVRGASQAVDFVLDAGFLALLMLVVFWPTSDFLDGQAVNDIPPVWDSIQRVMLCILLFSLATLMLLKDKQLSQFFLTSTTIFVISFVVITPFLVYRGLQAEPVALPDPGANTTPQSADTAATDKFATLGGEGNVILLVLETFQGSYVEELYAEDQGLFSDFEGFTIFSKAITPWTWSPFSVAHILTGHDRWSEGRNREDVMRYLHRDSLYAEARKTGIPWVASGKWVPHAVGTAPVLDNDGETIGPIGYAESVYERFLDTFGEVSFLSLKRIYPLRHWQALDRAKILVGFEAGQLTEKLQAKHLLETLIKHLHVQQDEMVFFYNFNYMTHYELRFDRVCEAGAASYSEKALLDEYYCALSLYRKLVNRLKSLGVYDSSLIILVGDHGAYQSRFSTYNPVIMVKPPGYQGRPKLSHANVSVGDVYGLIAEYLRGGNVEPLFSKINNYTDERKLTVFMAGADPNNPSQYGQITTEGGLDRIIERLTNLQEMESAGSRPKSSDKASH